MCGIAGILAAGGGRPSRGALERMLRILEHRGPDDEGIQEIPGGFLGHRRLAIIDLSPTGHQPMVDGEDVLVFNGEIYNHRDLRAELEREGAAFRGRSDTETLLLGYRRWGMGVIERLRGMFAFALWDGRERRLVCARDPFGKKPFYYRWDGRTFLFASEVEAVAAVFPVRPEPDPLEVGAYLLKGYCSRGRSIYSSIDALRPGNRLVVDAGRRRIEERPFMVPGFRTEGADVDDAGSLADSFSLSVRRRFESDVPVGVLLSGGVDSSLVSLVSAEEHPGRLRTFTATFKGTPADEGVFAGLVAAKVRTEHLEVDVPMAEVPELLPALLKAYGEPFGDPSAIPTYCLFEALKPHVKVVLTGDGGDEVFAGYKCVRLFLLRESLRLFRGILDIIRLGTLLRGTCSRSRRVREAAFGLIALRRKSEELWYSLQRDGWTSIWRKRFFRPEAWERTGGSAIEETVQREFRDGGATDLERYLNGHLERLAQGFLVKVDRASMAHSIEARAPFLDIDLFDRVRRLPSSRLLRGGEPKSIPKEMLASRMGSDFARRPKMGFSPPLAGWMRTAPAARWLEERLASPSSYARTLVAPEGIARILRLHRDGQDHSGRIWKLLFLSEWHRQAYGGTPS